MNRSRVEQILNRFSGKTILIIGDLMLDEFVWGKVRRISPEAPVPVVEVIEETYRLGGAGNVAANLQALGATPIPVGLIGRDRAAERFVQLMQSLDIDVSQLRSDDRPTTLKTRILAHNQQIVRADRENRSPLSSALNKSLESVVQEALQSADAMIVSDYDKGVVNRELMQAVLPQARDR